MGRDHEGRRRRGSQPGVAGALLLPRLGVGGAAPAGTQFLGNALPRPEPSWPPSVLTLSVAAVTSSRGPEMTQPRMSSASHAHRAHRVAGRYRGVRLGADLGEGGGGSARTPAQPPRPCSPSPLHRLRATQTTSIVVVRRGPGWARSAVILKEEKGDAPSSRALTKSKLSTLMGTVSTSATLDSSHSPRLETWPVQPRNFSGPFV